MPVPSCPSSPSSAADQDGNSAAFASINQVQDDQLTTLKSASTEVEVHAAPAEDAPEAPAAAEQNCSSSDPAPLAPMQASVDTHCSPLEVPLSPTRDASDAASAVINYAISKAVTASNSPSASFTASHTSQPLEPPAQHDEANVTPVRFNDTNSDTTQAHHEVSVAAISTHTLPAAVAVPHFPSSPTTPTQEPPKSPEQPESITVVSENTELTAGATNTTEAPSLSTSLPTCSSTCLPVGSVLVSIQAGTSPTELVSLTLTVQHPAPADTIACAPSCEVNSQQQEEHALTKSSTLDGLNNIYGSFNNELESSFASAQPDAIDASVPTPRTWTSFSPRDALAEMKADEQALKLQEKQRRAAASAAAAAAAVAALAVAQASGQGQSLDSSHANAEAEASGGQGSQQSHKTDAGGGGGGGGDGEAFTGSSCDDTSPASDGGGGTATANSADTRGNESVKRVVAESTTVHPLANDIPSTPHSAHSTANDQNESSTARTLPKDPNRMCTRACGKNCCVM